MSLVTRCPACSTSFKVVRDQLRISEGWVRCGRCSEVFDATLDLHEIQSDGSLRPASAPPPAPAAPPLQDDVAPFSPFDAALPPGAQGAPSDSLSVGPGPVAMSWPAADLLDLGAAAGAPQSAPAPGSRRADAPAPPPRGDLPDDALEYEVARPAHEPWFDEERFSRESDPALPSEPAGLAHERRLEPTLVSLPLHDPQDDLAQRFAVNSAETEPAPLELAPLMRTPSPVEEAVNAQLEKALRRERIKALRRERAAQKEREREAAHAPAVASPLVPVRAEGAAQPVDAQAVRDAQEAPAVAPSEDETPISPLLEAPSSPLLLGDTAEAGPVRPRLVTRLLLALACLLAAAALVLQVARLERDALLAQHPQLRPALQKLCDWTGCQLGALRRIGAITIEGASFLREKEGPAYRLSFTLRNGERVPVAMPAVELTLLDTQERALVRRVLTPAQFGAPAQLDAGADRLATLSLELSGPESAGLAAPSGFLLTAFYP